MKSKVRIGVRKHRSEEEGSIYSYARGTCGWLFLWRALCSRLAVDSILSLKLCVIIRTTTASFFLGPYVFLKGILQFIVITESYGKSQYPYTLEQIRNINSGWLHPLFACISITVPSDHDVPYFCIKSTWLVKLYPPNENRTTIANFFCLQLIKNPGSHFGSSTKK